MVHDPALQTNEFMLDALCHPCQQSRIRPVHTMRRRQRLEQSHTKRGGGGHPGPRRHVGIDQNRYTALRCAGFGDHRNRPLDIGKPVARRHHAQLFICGAELRRYTFQPVIIAQRQRHHRSSRQDTGQNEPLIIVSVLANQIHPAMTAGNRLRRRAKALRKAAFDNVVPVLRTGHAVVFPFSMSAASSGGRSTR